MLLRNVASHEVSSQIGFNQADPYVAGNNEGPVSKKVTFGDLVRSSDIHETENRGHQSDTANWNPKAPATTMDDPSSLFSPFLTQVLEEPSSFFSEGISNCCFISSL